jgi:predicted component of type VI protein secretion system
MAAQQIGIVTVIVGHVVAVNADGEERVLAVGDVVYADEIIRTSDVGAVTVQFNDGGWLDLGRSDQAVLDADVYSPESAEGEAAVASVEDIQAAILAGADPTQLLPPTAAGPGAGGGSVAKAGTRSSPSTTTSSLSIPRRASPQTPNRCCSRTASTSSCRWSRMAVFRFSV